ncbi:TPA: protein arginine kinase [bacterium]|nr:protein arginine kinase [bacterium]
MLEKYVNEFPEWLNAKGKFADIAVSTRIRLARNIKDIPFAYWASMRDLKRTTDMITSCIENIDMLKNSDIITINELSNVEKQFLVERHLISPELPSSKFGSVVISEKEMISIMINEEDHLRIQVLSSGFNLFDTWKILSSLDDKLSFNLPYAYSFNFGYLTSCPTNVGTGLRASVMLHIPGLSLANKIEKLLPALSKLGMVSRGFYGEKSESFGDLFQVSNQITLGKREEELIEELQKTVSQIISYEQEERELLKKHGSFQLEDRFKRAYALLLNAKVIPSKEAIELLSVVRLGILLDLLPPTPLERLNRLLIIIQPAHLQMVVGKPSGPDKRDIVRAELIHKEFL